MENKRELWEKRITDILEKSKLIMRALFLLGIQMIFFLVILLWLKPVLKLENDRFSSFLSSATSMMGLVTACINSLISYVFSFRSSQKKGEHQDPKLQEQVDQLAREMAELKTHTSQRAETNTRSFVIRTPSECRILSERNLQFIPSTMGRKGGRRYASAIHRRGR